MTKRKLFAIFFALILTLAPCAPVLAEEGLAFTVQPKGGSADNWEDFTVTWQTNASCRVMLQSRDDATYDWGNEDYVESPLVMNKKNFTQEYRLWASTGDEEAFSEPFRITWRPSDKCTAVTMPDLVFSDLPVGYKSPEPLSVSVTNTGSHPLRSPVLDVGGGTNFFEVVVNRTPHDIQPGETDTKTWSVRPLPGLGAGHYHEIIYLSSPALADYADFTADLDVFSTGDSDGETRIEADDVDLGTLEYGYPEQDTKDLVVRAVGGGTLKKVHLYLGDADTSFFELHQNNGSIDEMRAGTDSGTNWYLRLRSGLEPGFYECTILVYAENTDPAKVRITANILYPDDDAPASVNDNETPGALSDPTDAAKSSAGNEEQGSQTGLLIAVVAAAVACALIAAAVIIIKRAKINENNSEETK